MKKNVVLIGATGKMGLEASKMILESDQFNLVGAVSASKHIGEDIGLLARNVSSEQLISNDLGQILAQNQVDVVLDLTQIEALRKNAELILSKGIPMVVGTTGLKAEDKTNFKNLAQNNETCFFYVPNFAIGAVLMMKFAEMAARYMPYVEVIERHHEMKKDAPSGTALTTLERMAKVRVAHNLAREDEVELLSGARGGEYQGMRVHSLRMKGYNAHQEVIFGDVGQTLTIAHDSIHRSSFMSGIALALDKVDTLSGYVEGLDEIL